MEKSPMVTGLRPAVMARQNAQRLPRHVDQELVTWAVKARLRAHNCITVVARRGFISRLLHSRQCSAVNRNKSELGEKRALYLRDTH